jgi:hypothetical protein
VMNSDEEDALKEEHGDVLGWMYTSGMDPEKGPVNLTQAQVAAQKAATDASKTNVPAPVSVPEPTRQPTPVSVPADPHSPKGKRTAAKAAASQKAPAGQKPVPEAKASKPVPEAKASKPMETRRQAASRAGGLLSVGGSGQTGTRVAQGNPPKT